MAECTVTSELKNLRVLAGFLREQLAAIGCDRKNEIRLNITLDELFSNICFYGYGKKTGPVTLQLDCSADRRLTLVRIDEGVAFDPLAHKAPDITLPLEKRQIGGLGIELVKKSVDEITYRREDGKNILTLVKKL